MTFLLNDVTSNRGYGSLVLSCVAPVGHRHVTPRVSVFRLRILFIPFSCGKVFACTECNTLSNLQIV